MISSALPKLKADNLMLLTFTAPSFEAVRLNAKKSTDAPIGALPASGVFEDKATVNPVPPTTTSATPPATTLANSADVTSAPDAVTALVVVTTFAKLNLLAVKAASLATFL
ncbi:hypothetical protein L6270_02970 [Candidatus Parcubacteria bacterium]|nr:hypothetical protein [Patescibacteria group bacterium]MBU4308923.1 hypothetical protein [Patescibacteria group bacterium]MBU4431813.1 hypothetical protein [Patescibacteria group bacterium]MBU4577283.1 hypothetical protein [Patescibacteria group bacterium]MCG2696973.1 hypothetical protein [Candidatus Parcubacteria bacterium]